MTMEPEGKFYMQELNLNQTIRAIEDDIIKDNQLDMDDSVGSVLSQGAKGKGE